ncbi:MAG: hypothetical protein LBH32_12805 [Dysgonamonadaceae bacterium]|nr:hypothetical protein [Dysgonamonadaceae bacterium]
MREQYIINKHLAFYFTLFMLFFAGQLCGQENEVVKITNVSNVISDDSLKVHFTLTANNLVIGRQESLTLFPRITNGKIFIELPAVVYSGGLRWKFDERKRFFDMQPQQPVYHTYTKINKNEEYRLDYEVSVPYLSQVKMSKLIVEHHYDDCCTDYSIHEDSFSFDIEEPVIEEPPTPEPEPEPEPEVIIPEPEPIVEPPVIEEPVTPPPPPEPVKPKVKKETLYIEYPVREYNILANHGKNQLELNKLDNMLEGYHGRIWIKAYASPEGSYDANEKLAINRAEGFKKYLLQHYQLSTINVAHVAEDWEGLRKLIVENDIQGKAEALKIIEGVDVFDGREKKLMNLRGGELWRNLSQYFKQLRRIEIEIEDED